MQVKDEVAVKKREEQLDQMVTEATTRPSPGPHALKRIDLREAAVLKPAA